MKKIYFTHGEVLKAKRVGAKVLRGKRKEWGLCIRCGNKAKPGNIACQLCLTKDLVVQRERRRKRILNDQCVDCGAPTSKHKRLCDHHRIKRRFASKAHRFGMTVAKLKVYLEAYNGKCSICGKKSEMADIMSSRTGGDVNIDHNNITGIVRGILCRRCNMALGWFEYFQNTPDFTTRLKQYLEPKI